MKPTKYAEINLLLQDLLKNIQTVLSEKLAGLYLYGSAVWGDFDLEISDIDLLAATKNIISEDELKQLEKMHANFTEKYPEWNNRIEVQYQSLEGLKTFKTKEIKMANISPGEPLHFVQAGNEWLMNWYFVQDYGKTLFGPSPKEIIEPISKEEFIGSVRQHVKFGEEHVMNTINSKPYQGYAVMTMCRALYAVTYGEQVSKKKASDWVKEKFPQWKDLIENAFVWRSKVREEQLNPESTYSEIEKFIKFILHEISSLALPN